MLLNSSELFENISPNPSIKDGLFALVAGSPAKTILNKIYTTTIIPITINAIIFAICFFFSG